MTTRYSKEKYACIRGLKNEPLSNLAANSKKRKLAEEKGETAALPSIQIALSSPTPSLEVTVFTPPTTRSKGKGKAGMSLGRSYHYFGSCSQRDHKQRTQRLVVYSVSRVG